MSVALALPGSDVTFEPLTDKPVPIACARTAPGGPWCKSVGVVEAPIDRVADALEHMAENAALFENILSIKVLEPGTLHVVLDYPFYLSDRDYVAKYIRVVEGDVRRYRWVPVTHAGAPPSENVVRLPKFEGEWVLVPHPRGTQVTYLWHGEVGGSLPESAYQKAWKTAGHAALSDLAHTRNAALSAP